MKNRVEREEVERRDDHFVPSPPASYPTSYLI
jgi:hypothetical protein